MDELTYFDTLAKEVIKSQDPILQKLLAWCDDINIAINACSDKPETRARHSAVQAGALLMEITMLQAMQEGIGNRVFISPFNRRDAEITKFSFRLDRTKRTIEVGVEITDFLGGVQAGNYNFQPLVLPMHEQPQAE